MGIDNVSLDSGAARSVCPVDFCADFPIKETTASKNNEHFRTATGARVRNEGQRLIRGLTDEGAGVTMKYAVANIAVPLESVSQICDSGATVTFTKTGGVIAGPAGKIPFERDGDSYIRKTWVHRRGSTSTTSGFPRQGEKSS